MKLRKRVLRSTVGLLAFLALGEAIVNELRTPSEQRIWHGRVFGFVPYDLRPPTLDRVKASWWNPDDSHLFTKQPFGVGWTINLYRVLVALGF